MKKAAVTCLLAVLSTAGYLCVVVSEAEGQVRESSRRTRGRVPSKRFGELLYDEKLQEELQLTEPQLRRMRQIDLQSKELSVAVTLPHVEKELQFTDEQRQQITKIKRKAISKLMELRRTRRPRTAGEYRELKKDSSKIKSEVDSEILKLLTPTQQTALKRLMGPKYVPGKPSTIRPKI